MIRWLRVLYPLQALAALLFVPPMFFLLMRILFSKPDPLGVLSMFLIGMFSFAYGGLRVSSNHPILNSDLGKMLKFMPWSHGQQLPFGTWCLVPQDLVLLIWWTLLFCYGASIQTILPLKWWLPFLPIGLCIAGYVVMGAYYLFGIGQLRSAFLAILIVEISIPFYNPRFIAFGSMWILVVLELLLLYALVMHGLSRSVAQWGNETKARAERSKLKLIIGLEPQLIGWPFQVLSPQSALPKMRVETRLWLCLIYGWFVYLVAVGQMRLEFSAAAVYVISIILGLARLLYYISWMPGGASLALPPFTILAQIRSGRLFNWAFHRVLIVPLFIPIASSVIWKSLVLLQVPHPVACGISVAAGLLVAFFGGPGVENWRLTGQYRLMKMPTRNTALGGIQNVSTGRANNR